MQVTAPSPVATCSRCGQRRRRRWRSSRRCRLPRPRTWLHRRRLLPSRPLPSPRRHLRRRPPTSPPPAAPLPPLPLSLPAPPTPPASAPARAAAALGRAAALPPEPPPRRCRRSRSRQCRCPSRFRLCRRPFHRCSPDQAGSLIREARRERRYGGDPAAAIQLSRRCRRRRTRGERLFAPASEVDARAVAILSPCRKTQIRVCSGRARPATVPPGPSVPQRRFEVRDRVVEVAAPPRARPLLLAQTIDHASTPLTSRQSPNNETVSRSRVSGTNMSGQ